MKLYRFDYSCYARKVQMVLDLLGLRYDAVDVPYGDRAGDTRRLPAAVGALPRRPAIAVPAQTLQSARSRARGALNAGLCFGEPSPKACRMWRRGRKLRTAS